ncbi:hypothetical protein [Amycolatopsis anabasis]|uniref:hypothetical protein n=1 Tax=Amycolatopsis anabasis TaxID=1840409 RepID=UPI00131A64C6|nr:hypothetical protein [Amycolatopsis anabasis]
MLQILGAVDTPAATAYPDDNDALQFYVLPKVPLMRRDSNGKPVFKFVQYRSLRPLPSGRNGAALVFMDIEMALTAADEQALRQKLADHLNARGGGSVTPEAIVLSKPQITKASVTLDVLSGSGDLVQRVNHGGVPSMYGNNVVAFSAELTEFGAPVFAAAMKSEGAGGVRAEYAFQFNGRMPPVTAVGTWYASKFYSFVQEVDFEENFWSEDDFSEKVNEIFVNSESRKVTVDPGGLPNTDPAVAAMLKTVEDSVTRQLDEAVQRNLLEAIPPESRDFSKIRDEDFENIRREVTVNKIADVRIEHTQKQIVPVDVRPQANMPSLVSQGFKWEDFAITADVDDPFYRQFNLAIQVNAEFEKLPIFSVDVSIDYPPATAKHGIKTFSFKKADDIGRFDSFMDSGGTAFKYKYTVFYTGESRTFESEWQDHDGTDLKINIDDLGLWLVDVEVGDMNWDQVSRAVLTLEHPEVSPGVPPVTRFQIDSTTKVLQVKELLMEPAKPYGGSVKFFMKDGREFVRQLADLKGQRFYVDDPFSVTNEVLLRTRGDFEKIIDTIFLDLTYTDDVNGYEQTHSIALSKALRFDSWKFPVIDPRVGKVTYRTVTTFHDGTSAESGEKTLEGRTLVLGVESAVLEVTLVPDLIPWDLVKLAKVDLRYVDEANHIDELESTTFRAGATEATVSFPIRDRTKTSYEWTETFFMTDGTKRTATSAGRVKDEKLIIELPAA